MVELTITASPSAVDPDPSPGATTSTSPTSPASVDTRVARAGLCPDASRRRTIWSGTVPTIMAATLESIRVSATCTRPTPNPRSSVPTIALAPSSRLEIRRLFPRRRRMAARRRAATRKRLPAASSGGMVSIAILIPRYVEPQTK